VEGPGGAYFEQPSIAVGSAGDRAVLQFPAPFGLDLAALHGTELTVTVVDGARALETAVVPQQGRITPPEGAAPQLGRPGVAEASGAASLWTMLALAVLGGLILNLMPCVLPVLSLKLMSVIRKSGKETGAVRAGFLASAAGILSSFLVLGVAAVLVKQAGLTVGWGIQFQQPVFLAFMVALLTLFACNLLGFFEFRLPGALGDRAAAAGAGRNGLFGDFLTGAFATLLATPCTAPFLGTAIGFALSSGPAEILAVFAALGLGLALPYLTVAAFPAAVRVLPRPGPWMGWLKAVLALALAGTAVWLLTVMQVTVGWETALSVGMLAAVAAAVLAAKRLPGSRLGRAAWPVSAALALAAVAVPLTVQPLQRAAPSAEAAERIAWQPFDQAEIRRLVMEGRTVLVDVTADWCVTCQWNKKTVLESAEVAAWLDRPDVIAMRADWTRPDPVIAAYLERHGRYGIPFNIVYGPAAPAGIPLPELLSRDAVFAAAAVADPDADVAASQ
jgi:suppressor for copper-sensitivity B